MYIYPDANHGAGIFTYIYPKNEPHVGKYDPAPWFASASLIPGFRHKMGPAIKRRNVAMGNPIKKYRGKPQENHRSVLRKKQWEKISVVRRGKLIGTCGTGYLETWIPTIDV